MKSLGDIFVALFVLGIFGGILGLLIWMYSSFFLTSDKEAVAYEVLEKQSEKGLFMKPRYQVIVNSDSDVPNYVSKKQFDSLDVGDMIHGHETFEYGFFTKMDQFYDGSLLLIGIIFFALMFLIILFGFIVTIPTVDDYFNKREEKETPKKEKRNWTGMGFLIIVVIFMLIYSIPYTVNLVHKLVPINQTVTQGEIIDSEYNRNTTPKADYSTYEFTILFTAHDEKEYQVKKGVTSLTYDMYQHGSMIDIKYRNKNPYDIFIQTQDVNEFFGVIFNVHTLIYGFIIFIFYLLFRHYSTE